MMLVNKIFESMNIMRIEGDKLNEFIPLNSIVSVTLISSKYSSDAEAINDANRIVKELIGSTTHKIEQCFNPDFYPSLSSDEIRDKKRREVEALEDQFTESAGMFLLPMTHTFDELGDYVQYKSIATSERLKITIKTLADPEEYIKEIFLETIASKEISSTASNQISLH